MVQHKKIIKNILSEGESTVKVEWYDGYCRCFGYVSYYSLAMLIKKKYRAYHDAISDAIIVEFK